jgi:DNA invertase Pin-like site-specific DNA recombinase
MGLIGYARVSTSEGRQLLDRQYDALEAAGCERIFQDTASGADAARPGLTACLDHLRRHDVLVVLDLDRLGRLAHDLLGLIDGLEQRGIGFKALNSPMDTSTPRGLLYSCVDPRSDKTLLVLPSCVG